MNRFQKQAIEERLSRVIQRIERIEDKEELTEKDEKYLTELYGMLRGADDILTAFGYARRYHMGEEDAKGRIRGSYYTLEKI